MRAFEGFAWELVADGVRRALCPRCGRAVVLDEPRGSFSHELPVCRFFADLVDALRAELAPEAARPLGLQLQFRSDRDAPN